jgi:2-polyprenyl-3-methyl-5-hydroxy-6-metoxy-1,4-benzoquinol methylase
MADYDKYYKTEDLFGEPYAELIKFFKLFEPKGKLIDIGCGQGRDLLPLANLGYDVTGIDNSKLGISQMTKKAEQEKLKVIGLIGDIYKFDNYQDYDIVLLDSMFHFEKREKQKETGLITKIADNIKQGSLICICIQDTGNKVQTLKSTIQNAKPDFEVLNDSCLIYNYEEKDSGHKSKTKYLMYIVKKI